MDGKYPRHAGKHRIPSEAPTTLPKPGAYENRFVTGLPDVRDRPWIVEDYSEKRQMHGTCFLRSDWANGVKNESDCGPRDDAEGCRYAFALCVG